MVLGIDNGVSGALGLPIPGVPIYALIPTMKTEVFDYQGCVNMINPSAFMELLDTFSAKGATSAMVEQPILNVRGRSSRETLASCQMSFGVILSCLHVYGMPASAVEPKVWQNEMIGKKKERECPDTKDQALIEAGRIWPDEDFFATARSYTPHDGIIDALLIGAYGEKMMRQKDL